MSITVENVPPIYRQYPQFKFRCTCGRRLGFFQRAFEKMERELINEGKTVSESRIEIFKRLGITTVCCIHEMTNYPLPFICDVGYGSYSDITGIKNIDQPCNIKRGNDLTFVGEEFLPATRNVWGFDPNRYCRIIEEKSNSIHSRLGLSMREDVKLQFCNFQSAETKHFPIVFRSSILPPNNFH